jgi:integrase
MTDFVSTSNTSTALSELLRRAEQVRGTYASKTERTFFADSKVWTDWCVDQGLQSMPAEPETLSAFIYAMGEEQASATVRRYVSHIVSLHHTAQAPNPAEAEVVKLAMRQLPWSKGESLAQAELQYRGSNRIRDLRDRALLSVFHDIQCRRSDISLLLVEDIEMAADGTGTVRIGRLKKGGTTKSCLLLAADTMRLVTAWRAATGIETGPLFRTLVKGGKVGDPLNRSHLARVFKRMDEPTSLRPGSAVTTVI